MRLFPTAILAALVLVPAVAKAECLNKAVALTIAAAPEVQTASDLSAATKKAKVEYMKSAAGPEPAAPKKKKKKK